ncbi:MAG: DUF2262 domain-containing protein [Bacteroidetes bacterium]|nr:DUF2262 domain-containing protein [Bacteroidota bacterium]
MNRQWIINDFQRAFEESEKWTCSTYTSGIKINGNAVEVRIQLENCEVNDHAEYISKVANQHINWCVNNIQDILNYVAFKITPLANEWVQEGESELTTDDIKNRIFIQSINISGTGEFDSNIPIEDGNFILYFNDDDIFGGHVIQQWVDRDYILEEEPNLWG